MAESSPDSTFVKIIGPWITAAIAAAIGWLGLKGVLASAVTNLLVVVGGICGLAFHLMYKRYVGVLGAGGSRKGSPTRNEYDRLRENLSCGNIAARLYADRLTGFLVDQCHSHSRGAQRGHRFSEFRQRVSSALRSHKEMTNAIIRGKNGRRHEVVFGDSPVRVEVYASEETVEIFVEADFEILPEERRRFAIVNVPPTAV